MIPALTLYQVSLTDIAKSCLLLRVRNNEIEHGKKSLRGPGQSTPVLSTHSAPFEYAKCRIKNDLIIILAYFSPYFFHILLILHEISGGINYF
jgi:hypothetical protein